MPSSIPADLLTSELPFAFGGPNCSAVLRTEPEDFRVDEVSLVEASGKGEHLLLQIEKRNSNTDWLAGRLAELAGVPRRDVSYAGMKDRRAVTRQWFSVRLAGRPEPDWSAVESHEIRILHTTRHSRKLKRGALRGNRFFIRARQLKGDTGQMMECLQALAERGMPNYFGEQRFGHEHANLDCALAMFSAVAVRLTRQQRGLYLSAARSLLFNKVLAHRVASGSWNHSLPGERLLLDASRNSFVADSVDAEVLRRLASLEIHPSGPLWGKGDPPVGIEVGRLESEILAPLGQFRQGLEMAGLNQERRALRARISDLDWSIAGDQLELSFYLPKGSYATALLRECLDYRLAME